MKRQTGEKKETSPESEKRGSGGFVPIRNRRLFEGVVEQLTESIVKGYHKPGDRLPTEKELGQSFGVGRPAVREALRVLENAGLVFVRPGAGGGAFVKDIGSGDLLSSFETIIRVNRLHISQIFEALLVFEKVVLPLVFERITPEDISRLENSLAAVREAIANKTPEPRNLEFYIALAEASKNPLLIVITGVLIDIVRKYLSQMQISFERKQQVLRVHEMVLDHIRAKEYDEALSMVEKQFKEHAILLSKNGIR
jgi:GntR family transcriptional regulator, transcriptional repressor for pyruvate dehydrogenase complex